MKKADQVVLVIDDDPSMRQTIIDCETVRGELTFIPTAVGATERAVTSAD